MNGYRLRAHAHQAGSRNRQFPRGLWEITDKVPQKVVAEPVAPTDDGLSVN